MLSLNNLSTVLDRLTQVLFSDGLFFFIPYVFLYILFHRFGGEVLPLKNVFIFLSFCNFFLFIYYLYQNTKKRVVSDYLFWLCIILLFIIPGAYLEFPSDPWEHFRRIFSWQSSSFINSNYVSNKFAYFWGWTLMSAVQPIHRRFTLDLYSAFWQLLLAYQFYLLALQLGFSKSWAKLQVIATIFLFGTNVFSFYRYYALSSTPLAYIAYLQGLVVIINITKGRIKKAWMLPLLIPIIYYNHAQGILWLFIGTIAIILYTIIQKQKSRKLFWLAFALIAIASYYFGWWIMHSFQLMPKLLTTEKWLTNPPYLSQVTTIRLWDTRLSHFETLGVPGVLSLIFAFLFYSKHKLLSILTIAPYGLMLFPPFVLAMAIILERNEGDGYTSFRLLLAFPTSFMLVVGLKESLSLIAHKISFSILQIQQLTIIILLTIVMALPPNFPFRGRLWMQIYKPPQTLSLVKMDRTAQWFFKNSPLNYLKCKIATDGATNFMLGTHFTLKNTDRLLVYNLSSIIKTSKHLETFFEENKEPKVCGFLLIIPDKMPSIPSSKVAELSGHWNPTIVNQDLQATSEFTEAIATLTHQGWTRTFVPPFYWLYKAPDTASQQR